LDSSKNVERLASVETELKSIKEMLARMDGKLEAWHQNYVPRAELNEMFRARDKEIEEIKIAKQESRSLWPVWVGAAISLAGVITAIVALLNN
jgi:hypothetical protein